MQSAETLCTTPTDWLRLEYLLGIAVSAQQELATWSDHQKSHACVALVDPRAVGHHTMTHTASST